VSNADRRGRYPKELGFDRWRAAEVHIARTFKLEDAAEARQALNDHYLGKLALVLS